MGERGWCVGVTSSELNGSKGSRRGRETDGQLAIRWFPGAMGMRLPRIC